MGAPGPVTVRGPEAPSQLKGHSLTVPIDPEVFINIEEQVPPEELPPAKKMKTKSPEFTGFVRGTTAVEVHANKRRKLEEVIGLVPAAVVI